MTGKAGIWTAAGICALLATAAFPAAAMPAPFIWPESYEITISEKIRGTPGMPSMVTVNVDGMNTRKQILLPKENAHVEIYRMAEHKKIILTPAGEVQQSQLPSDWPARDPIFPASNDWEMITTETIGDQAANRYKVNRDDEQIHASAIPKEPYALVWFTSDNRTPLRMIDGNRVIEFSNYVPGPQDPSLFEARAKLDAAAMMRTTKAQQQPSPTPAEPEMTPVPPSAASNKLIILPAPKMQEPK